MTVRPHPVPMTENPDGLCTRTSPPPVAWPRLMTSAVLLAETPPAKSMDEPADVSTTVRAENATGALNTGAPLSATTGSDRAVLAVEIRIIPPENA